jgi:hypothetical protein
MPVVVSLAVVGSVVAVSVHTPTRLDHTAARWGGKRERTLSKTGNVKKVNLGHLFLALSHVRVGPAAHHSNPFYQFL